MYKRSLSTSVKLLRPLYKSHITYTPKLSLPSNYKSVILLSTPSLLPQVVEQAIKFYDENIQVIVAGIDTIKSSRHGVSELWLKEKIKIDNFVEYKEDNEIKDSDGINIVTVTNKNWKMIDSKFKLNIKNNTVELPLSNTIFNMNQLLTLFYLDKQDASLGGSDKLLQELEISLPFNSIQVNSKIIDKWTEITPVMTITESKGNLIKKINGSSASKFLENNDKLMSLASKDTEVFVKINNDNRYRIIAGGGGWGAKADTIVLSPTAKISPGDSIQIFMLTPQDKQKVIEQQGNYQDDSFEGFEFECSGLEERYDDAVDDKSFNSFGGGSELGFKFNDIEHKSIGEKLFIEI